MLLAHKVFYIKIGILFGLCKKTKNLVLKNNVLCETYFVFF
jgi:hypothetical protein